MLITVFKHKKRCNLRSCSIAILVLHMAGWFFMPASAEEECATDFFSQKTCRSFDITDWSRGMGQPSDTWQSTEGGALWTGDPGLSGSQIWYRNPVDGGWMSMTRRGPEALGNRAIHGFRCVIDLFGNVVCDRNQPIPETLLDNKSPDQR